ncbi:MAG: copper amine oxidase, partial [Oribacterium sp.]|nr:copper amine oxidase [Oribacterium sp.]
PADPENDEPLSLSVFSGFKILGKYTPLTFEDMAEIMGEKEDVFLVIDGKYRDEELVRKEFTDIRDILKKRAPEAIDRIIPQIYSQEMYDCIMEIYPWKSIIYTWYMLQCH